MQMTRSKPLSLRKKPNLPAQPTEVVFVLPRGSLVLDWAGPAEAFRMANLELQEAGGAPMLKLRFVGPTPQSHSSVGAVLTALEPLPDQLTAPAWVVVVGRTSTHDPRADAMESAAVVRWLAARRPGRPGMRLVTVCAGALLAAQAGLLHGKRVTTHHLDIEDMLRQHPGVVVEHDRVFVQDGEVWSSAGVSCGIDLALHLISDHAGAVVAARVAQRLAVALRRGPNDPQLSPFLAHRQHLHAKLHAVQDAIARAPQTDWTAARMAAVAHTTPRSLSRLFATHTQVTPVSYVRSIRVGLAQTALSSGSTVTQAAAAAGFSSDLQLRRAWRAQGLAGAPSGRGIPP
jgi:transcriptional regulator GlxA family with amidase domain